MSNTWYALAKNPHDESTDITIYDEIGGWGISAKEFIKELSSVTGHINLRLNSPGGSITDGTAIIAALKRHKDGFTAWVDGLAASMASVIACAADQCFMSEGSMMMIHRASTISMGDAADLRKDADILEKFERGLVNIYSAKTGMSSDEINALLAEETWLDPLEAIALGFADGISESGVAKAFSPAEMRRRFDTMKKNMAQTKNIAQPDPVVEPAAVAEPLVEAAPIVEAAPVIEPPAPAPAVEAEAEETLAPIGPVAPVARVSDLMVMLAEERVAHRDMVSALNAELAAERANMIRLEALMGVKGVSAAAAVPAAPVASNSDPVAEYLAAVESGDRKTAAKLFTEHKAALWAARNKIS